LVGQLEECDYQEEVSRRAVSDIRDVLDQSAVALTRAEQTRSTGDINEAAEAISDLAVFLEI
jgi:hypothetical protein